jgi:hypothetical protein
LRSAPDGEEITVPDFLEETRKEIADRLKDLKPVVDEFHRLEAAASALAGAVGDIVGTAASEAGAAVNEAVARSRGRGGRRASKATVASTATASTPAASTKAKAGRKKVGRPSGSGKKAGRPKGGGKRATEALSLIQGQPGITVGELATKMGIKQNYLYRVLPGLEKEGKLEKKGRGWYPKG